MSKTPSACSSPIANFDFEQILDPAVFRALGDTTRLALLGRLACACEPLTVSQVASCCGVHLSGVSRHLKMLLSAGLVTMQRQGREVRYQLRCEVVSNALRELADGLERCAQTCCVSRSDDEAGAKDDDQTDPPIRKECQDDQRSQDQR